MGSGHLPWVPPPRSAAQLTRSSGCRRRCRRGRGVARSSGRVCWCCISSSRTRRGLSRCLRDRAVAGGSCIPNPIPRSAVAAAQMGNQNHSGPKSPVFPLPGAARPGSLPLPAGIHHLPSGPAVLGEYLHLSPGAPRVLIAPESFIESLLKLSLICQHRRSTYRPAPAPTAPAAARPASPTGGCPAPAPGPAALPGCPSPRVPLSALVTASLLGAASLAWGFLFC